MLHVALSRLCRAIACLLMLLLAGGCAGTPGFIFVDGRIRTFFTYVPESVDGTALVPLVLAFHGLTEDGNEMATVSNFNALADTENFIVVYPEGLNSRWRVELGLGDPIIREVDDVAFIDALLDELLRRHPIDAQRIYVTGMSNGALMAYQLACDLGHRIAAIAPVMGATMPLAMAKICAGAGPMPVLAVHGTSDPLLPFDGTTAPLGPFPDVAFLSARESMDLWAGINGCAESLSITDLPDADPNDGTTVTREEIGPCPGGEEVILYVVDGGGHAWPGAPFRFVDLFLGPVSKDVDATEIIWEFFKRHSLPPS